MVVPNTDVVYAPHPKSSSKSWGSFARKFLSKQVFPAQIKTTSHLFQGGTIEESFVIEELRRGFKYLLLRQNLTTEAHVLFSYESALIKRQPSWGYQEWRGMNYNLIYICNKMAALMFFQMLWLLLLSWGRNIFGLHHLLWRDNRLHPSLDLSFWRDRAFTRGKYHFRFCFLHFRLIFSGEKSDWIRADGVRVQRNRWRSFTTGNSEGQGWLHAAMAGSFRFKRCPPPDHVSPDCSLGTGNGHG